MQTCWEILIWCPSTSHYIVWIFFGFNKQRWRKLKLLNLKMEERKFVKENPFRIQISNFHGEWMKNYANLSAICRLLCHNSKVRFLFSHQQFNFQFFDERKNHHGIFYAKRRRNILVRLNLSKKKLNDERI